MARWRAHNWSGFGGFQRCELTTRYVCLFFCAFCHVAAPHHATPPFTTHRFRIVGGAIVDAAQLYSLRLEDALPHHAITLTVQAALCSKEAAAAMGAAYRNPTKSGAKGNALKPTVLFEVNVDDFEDVLLQLKVLVPSLLIKKTIRCTQKGAIRCY